MTERRTLARPYAKAIFEIADHSKQYEQWSKILTVLAMISENPEVHRLLRDRTIASQDIAHFFLSISEKFLDEFSRNVVLVLASHKRLEFLPEIRTMYELLRAEKENTVEVQFVSPIVLSEEERERFKKMLEGYLSRTVKMQCTIDNNLIGGFVAKAGNTVIDGSILGQLTNLKEAMGDSL